MIAPRTVTSSRVQLAERMLEDVDPKHIPAIIAHATLNCRFDSADWALKEALEAAIAAAPSLVASP